MKLYGDPLHEKPHPARDFLYSILMRTDTECIIWPFSRNQSGYGAVRISGLPQGAHRAVCTLVHGPAPTKDGHAAHSCGNGHLGCVNPNHLGWKSPKENTADQIGHGTRLTGRRKPAAKLTEDQARYIRENYPTEGCAALARRFNVSRWSIHNIYKGKRWQYA